MKRAKIFILFLGLFFNACINKPESKIATDVKSKYGAQSCQIIYNTFPGNDSANQIEIVISNPDNNYLSYKEVVFTSSVSLFLFEALKPEEIKLYHYIKVTIANNSESFTKQYSMKELMIAKKAYLTVNEFFEYQNIKADSFLSEIIDTTTISAMNLKTITKSMSQIDSIYGKQNDKRYLGFAIGSNKSKSDSVLVIWVDVKNGKAITHYVFYISCKTKKVIYLGINDKENEATK